VDGAIERLDVAVFEVPTEEPEADGTLAWDKTTVVTVEATADGTRGLGFTYATGACAVLIRDVLQDVVVGSDPSDIPGTWEGIVRAIRNLGRPGVASMAIAAVDTALWDLKSRLLGLPLARLLGMVRSTVPIYASGGFTSLSDEQLADQLGGWVHDQGIPRVKIKIAEDRGTKPDRDLERVRLARKVIGDQADLFVDANGGYGRKQAVRLARELRHEGVTWFEEPVSSDDLQGLREIRDLIDIDVAAGEYGYDLAYFRGMLEAGAVDCLQMDVSRCAGITDWLRAAALGAAHGMDVSGHTAQSLHAHSACAVPNLRHLEYFADHARVDRLLFDGVLDPDGGMLRPDLGRPGAGLELKRPDSERFRKG
jgi:L-alanine-DL-glutamate epimerase-like enolase superfamily enzyme